MSRPLLMIPGPIEVSDAVVRASEGPPPGHLAASLIESFGQSIERMRDVWRSGPDAQPFIVAGSGTIAMDMAVTNMVDPGDRVVVADTGYFSVRIAEMARRCGAEVRRIEAEPGDAPAMDAVRGALDGAKVLIATHVDTSTGVRVDAEALCAAARDAGVMTIFDGVCATAAERFEMAAWGADVYLTASQKAIGLPPGLALLVCSPRALEARAALTRPPPMSLDYEQWRPIMKAYEARAPSYFSTPATTLVRALAISLEEILEDGMPARFELHRAGADRMRAAWRSMGLSLLPKSAALAAHTLSAIRYPKGVGPELVGAIKEKGVVVASGLHPDLKPQYFRVGHMGHVLTQPQQLARTVRAIGEALSELGHAVDVDAAVLELEG